MNFQLESSTPRIFPSTSSPSTGWKFSFLVLSEPPVGITAPSITVTKLFPRRILLLALTTAPAPIAVALVRFPGKDTLASNPMAVLLLPVVLLLSAVAPQAVLKSPVVLLLSAPTPLAALALPVVLLRSAWVPIAVLLSPVVLLASAWNPLAVLSAPVVWWSAWTPLRGRRQWCCRGAH